MRLASFNMRAGGSLGHWRAILEAAEPDLLFVQETKRPGSFPPPSFDHHDLSRIPWAHVEHGRWGSALYSRSGGLRLVTPEAFLGWIVGSEWDSPLGRVLAWSVHLPPVAGSYIKAANKLLDLLEPSVGVMPMVLAGDWNVTVGLRAPDEERQNRPGEAELLARLADDFGVRSAWSAANPGSRLPQTLRWARDPRPPYHCDGIFLPSEWCHRITSVQVLDGSPWTELSDHNPIVVDIET